MKSQQTVRIEGFVREDFSRVRTAFAENFAERGEMGAACSIELDGETVVDLWAGVRDRRTRDPWRADTMTIVHSTTKGFAAMVMAVLHSTLSGDPRDVALRSAIPTHPRRSIAPRLDTSRLSDEERDPERPGNGRAWH